MSSHASAASRTTSRWASLACPSTDYLSSQQPCAHFINPSPRWCSSLHVSRSSMKAAHALTQLVPIRANAPSTTQCIPIALDSHSAFHSLTRAFALFDTPSRLATAFLPSTTRPPHTAHCAPFTRTPSHPPSPPPAASASPRSSTSSATTPTRPPRTFPSARSTRTTRDAPCPTSATSSSATSGSPPRSTPRSSTSSTSPASSRAPPRALG